MVARLRRKARVNWSGPVRTVIGRLSLDSKAAPAMPISLETRKSGNAPASTSPEEMLAASHASCFAMSVRSVLDSMVADVPAALDAVVDVEATCVLAIDGTSWLIEETILSVAISGLDEDQAKKVIESADERCPVSGALRGNVHITKVATGAQQ
jgi:osmotically inducible protein OsmC